MSKVHSVYFCAIFDGSLYICHVKRTMCERVRLKAPVLDGATISREVRDRVHCASLLNSISSTAPVNLEPMPHLPTCGYRFQRMVAMGNYASITSYINYMRAVTTATTAVVKVWDAHAHGVSRRGVSR